MRWLQVCHIILLNSLQLFDPCHLVFMSLKCLCCFLNRQARTGETSYQWMPSKFVMKGILFVEVTHQEVNQQWCRFGILIPLAWHLRFLPMTLQAVLLCNWEILKTRSMLADEYMYYNAENCTQSVYACLGLPRLTDQLLLRVEFCSIKSTLLHLFISPS